MITITIKDEVNATFSGVPHAINQKLHARFGPFVPGYMHTPKYKLGVWDGKIRFYNERGETYTYLIEPILEAIMEYGGHDLPIELVDKRPTVTVNIPRVTENIFAHIKHPKSGEPIILRDYQVELANALIDSQNGIGRAATGAGKCQPLHSKVLTSTGWLEMGQLRVGDLVVTPTGKHVPILQIFEPGEKDTYRLTLEDGRTVESCGDHLWKVSVGKNTKTIVQNGVKFENLTTEAILKKIRYRHNTAFLPLIDPLLDDEQVPSNLPVDPYAFGWIIVGQLVRKRVGFAISDQECINRIRVGLESSNTKLDDAAPGSDNTHHHFVRTLDPTSKNKLDHLLKVANLYENGKGEREHRYIPRLYLTANAQQRLALLQGILDARSHITEGSIQYNSISPQLVDDVEQLARSLGCIVARRSTIDTEGRSVTYRIQIKHPQLHKFITRQDKLKKLADVSTEPRIDGIRIRSITPISKQVVRCILIDDPDHLYITDNYIVTHNTLITAALSTVFGQAGIRTLTIVPDVGLVKQTKADYELVGLDVGEVSGTKKEVNKTHVVTTWQSLKNIPHIVKDFGMIMVDEAHKAKSTILNNLLTKQAAHIPFRFGVTGTLPEEEVDKLTVHCALGPVRYVIPASVLIDRGVLAKPHIEIWKLKEDMTKQYQQYLKDFENLNLPPSSKMTYKMFQRRYFANYEAEKSYLMTNKTRLQYIADSIIHYRETRGNIMILVPGVKMARALGKLIENSVVVSGTDVKDANKRKAIYDRFEVEDNLCVICTVHIASTGISINRIFTFMYVDIGKSFTRVIQSIGRGLRTSSDKTEVLIVDVCSDLHYSELHEKKRIKFYEEEEYPYETKVINYVNV